VPEAQTPDPRKSALEVTLGELRRTLVATQRASDSLARSESGTILFVGMWSLGAVCAAHLLSSGSEPWRAFIASLIGACSATFSVLTYRLLAPHYTFWRLCLESERLQKIGAPSQHVDQLKVEYAERVGRELRATEKSPGPGLS
jgi:hypothetical protein